MATVSIGEAARRVVERAATMISFQEMLSGCPTAENKRSFINFAFANGALSEPEHRCFIRETMSPHEAS